MRRASPWLLALLVTSVGAPAQNAAPGTYSGRYFYNFENANFTPDGSKDCWVIRGGIKEAEITPTDGSAPWGSAHVVVRGVLSAPGHHGNLGACTHVLKVTQILEITDKKAR